MSVNVPYTFVPLTDAESAQVNANFQALVDAFNQLQEQVASQGAPIGSVQAFGGTEAPDGWLMCRGQQISRSVYEDLFNVIGTRFGSGNGLTTFNLPDGRGRSIIGPDDGAGRVPTHNQLGQSQGVAYHQLTQDELPPHTHSTNYNTSGRSQPHQHTVPLRISSVNSALSGVSVAVAIPAQGGAQMTTGNENSDHVHAQQPNTGSVGLGNGHYNMPPYVAMNWIMRARA